MNGSDNIDQFLVAHAPTDATAVDNPTVPAGEDAIESASRDLGLKSLRAWVPDTATKRRSAGAERAQRHRERKEHDGIKQISVMLPSDLHPALRELAKRTRGGEPVDSVLREIFPAPSATTPAAPTTPATLTAPPSPATPTARPTPPVPNATAFEAKLEMLLHNLPAWRQWLLRRLLPPLASH